MATGPNVKMRVDGVSKFKQDMKQAQSSVKTLDEALKRNEAQFKQTGDAETYMQEKSDLLNRKMEQQQKVVDAAKAALNKMEKDGVNKASDAYQKMQQQVLRAETDLINTENAMNGVAEAGAEAAASANTLNENLKGIESGVGFQNVTEGIGKITGAMEAAFKKAIQLGKAITKEVLGAGSWADDLATKAAYYQVSEEDLQRMEKTANLIDTSVEAIVKARSKLKKGLGNDDKGVNEALQGLFGEGFESKNWEDTFWKAGEALMKMTDAEEQEAYAQKLYGKSWSELIPLFQAGREEYEKVNASWNVVSQENIDKLKEMDDQYQKLSSEFETFKLTLLSSFAEPLTKGMESVTALFAELNKYLESPEGKAMLEQLGSTITTLIEDLTKVSAEDIVGGLKGVVDGITEAFKWIQEHHGEVKTALEVIAGGFVALKLGEAALNIGKVVSGFKTLWKGAKNPLPGVPGTDTGSTGATGAAAAGGGFFAKAKAAITAAAPTLAPAAAVAATSAALFAWAERAYDSREWGQYRANVAANEGNETALMTSLRHWISGDEDWVDVFEQHAEELRALTPDNPVWDLIGTFADLSDGLQQAEINDLLDNWFNYGLKGEDFTEGIFKDAYNRLSEDRDVLDKLSNNMVKPEDIEKLDKLPQTVADAVSKVGFVVELDGENVVAVINRRLGIKLAGE